MATKLIESWPTLANTVPQRMQEDRVQAQSAVTWARDHVFERSAVQDGRAILETARWHAAWEKPPTATFNRNFSAESAQESSRNFRRLARADSTRRELWQGWNARSSAECWKATDAILAIQCLFRPRSVSPPKTVIQS